MGRKICKGHCSLDKRFRLISGKYGYKQGYVMCSVCEKGISTDLILCPCCKNKLRRTTRGKKN